MLADSDIVPECIVSPGSLGGLISLYEGNAIKLATLLGNPASISGPAVSRSATDCSLHLTVEEGSRYTRMLRLTYLFEEPAGVVADPDLALRIYLDARVVEVTAWADFHRHDGLAELAGRWSGEIDRRWARNMVLSKWLDFLLDHGHRFSAAAPG